MKKIRPLGTILLDLEPLLEEMIDEHDLQFSDVEGLIRAWMKVHRPSAQEEFLDGTKPDIYYK